MIQQFADRLRKEIEEEGVVIKNQILHGRASSFDQYRHLTGILLGLELAKDHLNDLMAAYNKE